MSDDSEEVDPLGPAASESSDCPDYEIGYGKPPPHGTWKKGQSGNPKGAPKQVVNLMASFNAMLDETDVNVKGGSVISKSEAMVRALVEEARKCDQKAFAKFLWMLKRAGLLEPPVQSPGPARTTTAGFSDMASFKAQFGKPLPKNTKK